jgi:hypothetical protein
MWLKSDDYDYIKDKNYLSVTSLIKPTKQFILGSRVTNLQTNLIDRVSTSQGQAVHTAIALAATKIDLLPPNLRNLYELNPVKPDPDKIQVYMEQRAFKEFLGYRIGGKFDYVQDGVVHDIKTTSTMSWNNANSLEYYKLQGSLYRWLNPDIITKDYMVVDFIFGNWTAAKINVEENYPPHKLSFKVIPLYSLEETEQWLTNKINDLTRLLDESQDNIPDCSPEEMWQDPPVYKYYASPDKLGRSTKNFTSEEEARKYRALQAKGVVLTVSSRPRKCGFCSGASICKQKELYESTTSPSN